MTQFFSHKISLTLLTCFISFYLFSKTTDTIPLFPTMKLGNEWIELGIGGSYGNYGETRYAGSGQIFYEKIKVQSVNFDGSYNWGLRRGRAGIGLVGSFGSVILEEHIDKNYFGFNFSAIGVYGVIEGKMIGVKYGFLYVDHHNPPYMYGDHWFPLTNLRFGKARSYHVDLSAFDEFGMGTFPEPTFSLGIFNFGFNDPSGMRKIRIAFSQIIDQTVFSIGFRHPISQAPLLFDGSVHFFNNYLFMSMGIRYRFDMSWK